MKLIQNKLSYKINLLILSLVISVIVIMSALVIRNSYELLTQTLGTTAMEVAAVTSATIDPSEFNKIQTVDDTKSDYYKNLQEKISYIREKSGSKYLYTMRKNDKGEYIYVIDGSEEPAEFGQVEKHYTEFDRAYAGDSFINNKLHISKEYGVLVSAYHPIVYNGEVIGIVGVDYDVEKGYIILRKMINNILILAVTLAAFALIIGFIFSRRISRPLERLAFATNKISDFDLNIETIDINTKDEIGNLTKAFNLMVTSIKDIIKDTKRSANTVLEMSKSLFKIAEHVDSQSSDISQAIQHVAEAITEQAYDIDKGSKQTGELAESIEKVADSINAITDIFSQVYNLNDRGSDAINLLIQKSKEEDEAVKEAEINIKDMDESSQKISVILDTVEQISDQTNLLALNASIEAARSGEYGRGFAVVAEEIRKLADESAKSTEQIKELISAIEDRSKKAVKSMEISKKIAGEQNNIVNEAGKIFKELSDTIKKLAGNIETIEALNRDMNLKKDAIVSMIGAIQESTEEISAVSQETSASYQEILFSVNQLKEHSQTLSNLAEELGVKVDRFNT
ncbi:HAMP domain-containing protein [Tepidanaerobacter sp. GT38]|uniref:methyl-accepting chemotaxis protein n=1 Tax=Tepidanaerobacter sp. GT38 TaxID=2722793 RepID=UPI001EFFA043|nr:methyl-accepting chemotaxis protein [Tepidanaerobacter sp. GT38]MCG1011363.1 HAMP domain-containing protein [Tepidanaerobacter sp. GT38]